MHQLRNASPSFGASTSQSVILLQQLRSCEEIFKTYPIYINFYLNKKESSNPKPICVYQILDQPGL